METRWIRHRDKNMIDRLSSHSSSRKWLISAQPAFFSCFYDCITLKTGLRILYDEPWLIDWFIEDLQQK